MRSSYLLIFFGGALRYFLLTSNFSKILQNRVEIATPLNSIKRVFEGIYLLQNDIDPYNGDIVHETPIFLRAFMSIFEFAPQMIPHIYLLIDLLTSIILYKMSRNFVKKKLKEQKKQIDTYAAGTQSLRYDKTDIKNISHLVLIAYLFNPLSVANCVGLTSTVFSNFLLALIFYCLANNLMLPGLLFMAIESIRNLYPIVFIAPAILIYGKRTFKGAILVLSLFCLLCAGVAWFNFWIMNSWSYIDGTLGFIFFYRDLQPNIGLFWYFFTEMFEHFRSMFLITFQMNATILYLLPLSLKLRKEPLLLATVLCALMAIFKSYPCLGDVSFYLTLLPLWRKCWKFMAHNFIVFGFFIVTLSMLPALWHLWIYSGSANANFYFGVTLAFSTGQIFLVTDLLFAYVKREFCLLNGEKIFIDGKEAKIILE